MPASCHERPSSLDSTAATVGLPSILSLPTIMSLPSRSCIGPWGAVTIASTWGSQVLPPSVERLDQWPWYLSLSRCGIFRQCLNQDLCSSGYCSLYLSGSEYEMPVNQVMTRAPVRVTTRPVSRSSSGELLTVSGSVHVSPPSLLRISWFTP